MKSSIEYATSIANLNYKISIEFGVAGGHSLRTLRKNLPNDHRVYGFDSFLGLPEDWVDTPQKKGAFSTNGIIPEIDNVKFYPGWFDETIATFKKEIIIEPLSILHIDCDLYSSTKTVLYGINEFISINTIIVFDEWIYNNNPKCSDHEQKAFLEWAEDTNRTFRIIKFKDLTHNGDERKIVQIA